MKEDEIRTLRKKIDGIDKKIIELLDERFKIVLKIGRLKERIFDPQREEEILNNLRRHPSYLIDANFIEKLFGLILKRSKDVQEEGLRLIGFQGEHGAYSEIAAMKFDRSLVPIPCMEFEEIFEETEKGILDFGIVPIENSLEGGISKVLDLLLTTKLYIVGEVNLPIHHCLLALPDDDYRDLKVVYSHPQALNQCRDFINRHKLEPRPYYDTAGAARMLSENRLKGACVIASKLCASIYNLEIIKENVEDHPDNVTRFVVLSSKRTNDGDKCSVIFSAKHEVGALFRILKIFSEYSINLTKIESRPKRGDPGHYLFYTDFYGSEKEERVRRAIEDLKKETDFFKFLGCYTSRGDKE
ncbi:MAG: prephenate dehydratase [Desulfobacterota bacterium]|nr:prephenate dehydratase [Thermodesulfobacteriota bacterium]MDW8002714.1 prephenate dehydratase [Deltaproteobacteria bacterium]